MPFIEQRDYEKLQAMQEAIHAIGEDIRKMRERYATKLSKEKDGFADDNARKQVEAWLKLSCDTGHDTWEWQCRFSDLADVERFNRLYF